MNNIEKAKSRQDFEDTLKKSLHVDQRYTVLDFRIRNNYLYVFTDSLANAIHISRTYQRVRRGFRIKVVLLPDSSTGGKIKGICHVGVAPVRRADKSASEQVTQILLGETFDTLQVEDGWVRVRLHADGYIGWVSADQVSLFEAESFYDFQLIQKVQVLKPGIFLLDRPSLSSRPIRETVYGSTLSVKGSRGSFFEVVLPDRVTVWVEKSAVKSRIRPKETDVRKILETALSFEGISYVWGGRSSKGFDCSGFVQTVFRINGIELPRDADMQFSAGIRVGKSVKALRPGDLLFFSYKGDKINHVAIYAGKNKEFIHSSGYVRVNSLDPARKNFSKKLHSSFVGACRVV